MEITAKSPVVAEIPNGVLLDIWDPNGNSVMVISLEEHLKQTKINENLVYHNYCVIEENKIIAGPGYPYNELFPVVVEGFPKLKKHKNESWK